MILNRALRFIRTFHLVPAFRFIAIGLLAAAPAAGALAERAFPFDRELLLDADPMLGSKRIPNMDVAANGAMALEMWCNRMEGQLVVAANTITVLAGPVTDRSCPPERARGDANLLAALSEVTSWRWEGESTLLLIGPQTLRFRLPTN